MSTELLLIVLAVLLIAVSVFFGLKVLSIYRRKTASAGWPTAAGQVLSRDVSSTRNSQSSGYTYRAEITYSYPAPGGPYEKKLFLGSKGVRAQAEKLLASVGDAIQVHYNPEKPVEHISDYEKISAGQIVVIAGALTLAVVMIVLALI